MKTRDLFNILEDSELVKLATNHPEELMDLCSMMSIEFQLDKEKIQTLN
jgi:hypothetical protein